MDEIWYSDSIITNEIILNSFKYAWISSELDESEDYQFRSDEDLEKGDETIELGNEEALDQEDAYVISRWSDRLYKFFI